VTHTAATNELAGTVLTMPDFNGELALLDRSDQLIVYQAAQSSPSFICALDNSGGYTSYHCAGSAGGWHQAICDDELDLSTNPRDLKYYSA
jgi:hypothetical protein